MSGEADHPRLSSSHAICRPQGLNKAAAKGHFEMVEWILGVVDPSNVLVRDAAGRSAADAAADARFPHLAALLEERVRAAEDAHRRRYEAAGYNIFR